MKPAHRVSKVLFISGPTGIGKTSVSEALARQLRIPYYDLDEVLETEFEDHLSTLIKMWGWNRFRYQETRTLTNVIEKVTSLNQSESRRFLSADGHFFFA